MECAVFDLETDGLLPELTKIHCVSVGDPKTNEVSLFDPTNLDDSADYLGSVDRQIAHNGCTFDLPAYERFYPGIITLDKMFDTFLVAKMLRPDIGDHRLMAWGERMNFPKGDYDGGWEQYSEEMGTYCKQDSAVTIKLYRHIQAKLREWMNKGVDWRKALEVEHKVAFIIGLQERHGFRLDVKKAQELEGELRVERNDNEQELQETFPPIYRPLKANWDYAERKWAGIDVSTPKVGNVNGKSPRVKGAPYTKVTLEAFNPGSRQQCVFRITSKYPWKPSKFTPSGQPQVDDSVLEDMLYPEATKLSRYFRLTKMLGQIADGDNAWLKKEKNGRVHGRVNSVGTRTFRMTHSSPNLAQVDKKDLRMRAVWVADVGQKLVNADASGLELRMLGNRLHRWDGGAFSKAAVEGKSSEGTDVHSRNQELTGLFSRDSAKTLIYAFLYGAGNEKLGTIMIKDAMDAGKPIPKGAPRTIGKKTRVALEEGITGLKELIALCKKATKERGWLKGLDGRPVTSPSEHAALNTLLQSDGALVMKYAMKVFHFELASQQGHVNSSDWSTATFNYVVNVHDEVGLTTKEEHAATLGQMFCDAIQIAGEQLGVRCPLAGEYQVGNNWAETH